MATRREDSVEERFCWICFASDVENDSAIWVHPCKCRGTTKWVHHNCLHCWIDEKQRADPHNSVVCQQCQTAYIVILPKMNRLAIALEKFEYLVRLSCPFVVAFVVFGTVYWTAITYGAITVIQVMGHQQGIALLERSSPAILMLGLPMIPVGLLLSNLIHWEDGVLRLIRAPHITLRRFPFLKWIMNLQSEMDENDYDDEDAFDVIGHPLWPSPEPPIAALREPLLSAHLVVGAILLPTMAVVVGKLIFSQFTQPMHQTLLGGVTYIGLKGMLKIYLRQKQFLYKRGRRILNYTDENVRNHRDSS